MRIDRRWTTTISICARKFAKELVGLQPDVIFASGPPATAALQRETRTIPIVFFGIHRSGRPGLRSGPAAAGRQPHRVQLVEAAMMGKWLQMLKEIAPRIRRAAFMYNPDFAECCKKIST